MEAQTSIDLTFIFFHHYYSTAIVSFSAALALRLEIQPNQKVIDKEVGQSLALICRPNVPNPALISQLEWRDPKNLKIDTSDRANPVYVQVSEVSVVHFLLGSGIRMKQDERDREFYLKKPGVRIVAGWQTQRVGPTFFIEINLRVLE